jgi:hypothetical protein
MAVSTVAPTHYNFSLSTGECENIGKSNFWGTKNYLNVGVKEMKLVAENFTKHILLPKVARKMAAQLPLERGFKSLRGSLPNEMVNGYEFSSKSLNIFQRIIRCLFKAFSSTHFKEVCLVLQEFKNGNLISIIPEESDDDINGIQESLLTKYEDVKRARENMAVI